MSTRNYSNIYNIKEFASKELFERFFDPNIVSKSNLGAIGYVTELLSTGFEDIFNSMSLMSREFFPNTAILESSIYNMATAYRCENFFAKPSQLTFVLFIKTEDIIRRSVLNTNTDQFEFFLDNDTVVMIDKLPFMMDYDICVLSRMSSGKRYYQVQYDFTYKNSISAITSPYISSKTVVIENTEFLMITVDIRQVRKTTVEERVTQNEILDNAKVNFNYSGKLCNFEVYYKDTPSSEYIQLVKLPKGAAPIDDMFCYYSEVTSNEVEISFPSSLEYFKPAFNSDLKIDIFTTDGIDGNFDVYQGKTIDILAESDKWLYNSGLQLFGYPASPAINGRDRMTFNELKSKVNESFVTLGTIINNKGLELFFNNFSTDGNKYAFAKNRDDCFIRLFSAYTLFRNNDGVIYPTNTLNLKLEDANLENVGTDTYVLKPGRLFAYEGESKDTLVSINRFIDNTLLNDASMSVYSHVFCLPFLVVMTRNPQSCAFYLNTIDKSMKFDFNYLNELSPVQFICSDFKVRRYAIMRESSYAFTVSVEASIIDHAQLAYFDETTGSLVDTNRLKLKLFFYDASGDKVGFIDLSMESFNPTMDSYTFHGVLTTNDNIDGNGNMTVNLTDVIDGVVTPVSTSISMDNSKIDLCVFYDDDNPIPHEYSVIPDVNGHSLTNIYSTPDDEGCTFIQEIKMFNSNINFEQGELGETLTLLSLVPMTGASVFQSENYMDFINNIGVQYAKIYDSLNVLKTGFNLAIKAFNTYGRSKYFVCGDNGSILDNVDLKISFTIRLFNGVNGEAVITALKNFIKEYIENINNGTTINNIYVSDIIAAIKENFTTQIKFIKFVSINNYDASVQAIESKTNGDLEVLSGLEKITYIPEYITIRKENISIAII